jgi:hypothetical protein
VDRGPFRPRRRLWIGIERVERETAVRSTAVSRTLRSEVE